MRHHLYNKTFEFVKEPVEFNKYTDREMLQYCLGASMYMPGTKDFTDKILNQEMPGLTTMVLDMEDACPEDQVDFAERQVLDLLSTLSHSIDSGRIQQENIPLIFIRVRNIDQFHKLGEKLTKQQARILAGFNFPKFNSANGEAYCRHLKELNEDFEEILYGMPIIEDVTVAHKETRMDELLAIKDICDRYRELVLQIRVGATDFSSCFGVRRGVDYSIYDISVISEILSDIVNVFGRNNDYVISGPVWEYFRASKEMMFTTLPRNHIHDALLRRESVFEESVDGLLREIILDKANGFVGRTVIHPTHVKFVNALQAVTQEEYEDAVQILEASDGVIKSPKENKMNEIRPHTNWAKKVYMKAQAYGVIRNEMSFVELFAVDD